MRISNTSLKLSFLVLLIFLFSSLYASETRVATMGGGGIFVKDQSLVFLFPGTIHQYPDLVVAEMRARGNDAFYSLGIHMDYGNMVSGLYINQPINSLALAPLGGGYFAQAAELNNALAYMLGLKLGGFDAGFGFIGASSTYEDNTTDPVTEENAYYAGIVAGISNEDMDIGLKFELPSIEVQPADNKYSGFVLMANGRYRLMQRNGYDIFPVASFGFGTTEIKDAAEFGLLSFALGVGVEKQINEDNLLVVGLEVSRLSITTTPDGGDETVDAVSTLPGIYVGVESRISSWLIGRIGATHVNQLISEEVGGDDESITLSEFRLSLGLGMEFSNFLLDFNFNETSLFDGIYIFDGVGGTTFASTVSITYNFGGGEDEEN